MTYEFLFVYMYNIDILDLVFDIFCIFMVYIFLYFYAQYKRFNIFFVKCNNLFFSPCESACN